MLSIDDIIKKGEKNKEIENKKAIEHASRIFGFNKKGWVWLLLEELNELEKKEKFKALGGLYDKILGWHSENRVNGFKMSKVQIDSIGEVVNGVWQTRRYKVDMARKTACRKKLGKRKLNSEFVGSIGNDALLETKVKLVSVKETMFRDRYYDIPGYYGLPFRYDYTFNDKDGNIIVFSSAYYNPKIVQEWFGNGWADLTAKVIKHEDLYGAKVTKIMYPEISKKGKLSLKSCARIQKPVNE